MIKNFYDNIMVGHKRVRDIVYGTEYGSKTLVKRSESIFEGRGDLTERISFIQGYLTDNIYLEDSYELQFVGLTPEKRLMELKGEWDVAGDTFFSNFREKLHVRDYREFLTVEDKLELVNNPHLELPYAWRVWGFVDKGFHDRMPIHYWAITTSNHWVCFKSQSVKGLVVEQLANVLDKNTTGLNFQSLILPPDTMRRGNTYKNDSGELVGQTQMEYLQWRGYNCIMANNNRAEGWGKCHGLLYIPRDENTGIILEGAEPRMYIDPSNTMLIDGLRDTTKHPRNSEEISGDQPEDDVDDFRYMAMFHDRFIRNIVKANVELSGCGKIFEKAMSKTKVKKFKNRTLYKRPY